VRVGTPPASRKRGRDEKEETFKKVLAASPRPVNRKGLRESSRRFFNNLTIR